MTLTEYIQADSAADLPRDGRNSRSPWLEGWNVQLETGRVHVADPSDANCDMYGCVLLLAPGAYRLELQVARHGGRHRVAAARLRRQDIDRFELGARIGDVTTDVASIAVYDFEVFTRVDVEDDARWLGIDETRAFFYLCQALSMADVPNSEICLIKTGFGDGTFAVMELISSGERIGFEIEFIDPVEDGLEP